MVYNLYFLTYNNKYNRILKREETIEEYMEKGEVVHLVSECNFNPNDDITAELDGITDYNIELAEAPDYMVACNSYNNTILSRWYVTEFVYQADGCYKAIFVRDVLADWKPQIFKSPVYLEKGWLTRDDPAIFNLEDVSVNQIKKAQIPVTDSSGCQWLVGYIPKNVDKISASLDYLEPHVAETVDTLNDWTYYDALNTWYDVECTQFEISNVWSLPSFYSPRDGIGLSLNLNKHALSRSETSKAFFQSTYERGLGYTIGDDPLQPASASLSTTGEIDPTLMVSQLCEQASPTAIEETFYTLNSTFTQNPGGIDSYTDLFIKVSSTSQLLRVVKKTETITRTTQISGNASVINAINNVLHNAITVGDQTFKFNDIALVNQSLTLTSTIKRVRYEVENTTLDFVVSIDSSRGKCLDSPYDIFCIPYDDGSLFRTDEVNFRTSKQLALSIAAEIANSFGSQQVYDIQLLPYCPIPELINQYGQIDARNFPVSYVEDIGGNYISAIIWCSRSSNSFSVNFEYEYPENALDFKIANQCDFFRLVSPTDGSAFDFTPTKNRGFSKVNVTYTYKPFQPYIHVAPEFDGLYNKTFDYEKRGLILRGDFSIAKTSEAWANYKAQNANYQDIFNRQIENMEVTQELQRNQEIWSVVGGSLAGAATGAAIGSVFGPVGAAIGGGLGAIISAAGGYGDIAYANEARTEAIDYTKDQFAMNLQAIKAQPNTLTKVSAFDIDCSPFPMLEYYTCTEIEKKALRDKILYNGMTINRIGFIEDFLDYSEDANLCYIKGLLIRINDVNADSHVVNAISHELNKGVFV